MYTLALLAIVFGYISTLIYLKKKQARIDDSERSSPDNPTPIPKVHAKDYKGLQKSALSSFLITVSHFLLYVPTMLVIGLHGWFLHPIAIFICDLVVYSEFLIHPVVLLIMSTKMRNEVKRTLRVSLFHLVFWRRKAFSIWPHCLQREEDKEENSHRRRRRHFSSSLPVTPLPPAKAKAKSVSKEQEKKVVMEEEEQEVAKNGEFELKVLVENPPDRQGRETPNGVVIPKVVQVVPDRRKGLSYSTTLLERDLTNRHVNNQAAFLRTSWANLSVFRRHSSSISRYKMEKKVKRRFSANSLRWTNGNAMVEKEETQEEDKFDSILDWQQNTSEEKDNSDVICVTNEIETETNNIITLFVSSPGNQDQDVVILHELEEQQKQK